MTPGDWPPAGWHEGDPDADRLAVLVVEGMPYRMQHLATWVRGMGFVDRNNRIMHNVELWRPRPPTPPPRPE